jgi:hypothetical protein
VGGAGPRAPSASEDLARARAESVRAATQDRTLKREEADKKALTELQEAEKAIWQMNEIEKDSEKYNTGPFADRIADVASTVLPEAIYNPSDRNAWKARVARQYNAILKEQSGAAITASEETRQLVAQLNTRMDDSTFDKVLRDIRESYQRDLENAKARLTPTARQGAAAGASPMQQAAPEDEGALMDAIMDEHPDWSDEQVADELERRKRNG